ncbi:hypothetical protein [Arenimonas terrae]|uniref:Uncharacterized protein n=1 Tax=Arenimonas terrae TaxID=2546226 RepID=A0A5C4RXE9_9GAMM|nr:hypothetical protein [Arenimonas terrae]TNJ35685.1 hypothetical protein E1B00_08040 [Arenimonas terrae]
MSKKIRSRRFAALALVACAPLQAADEAALPAGFEAYVTQAQAIVTAFEQGAAPAAQQPALTALAERAAELVPAFSARHPVCRDYLAAALPLRETWPTLSLARIERDYHHDAALPKIASAGDHGLCYQMKDLLVHPLTALRMLAEPEIDRAGIAHEITEVVAHGRALQALEAAR